ncbi:MAG: Rpp14/Pop5 family protein [Candidatus Woesearchaeota archaeon]
MKPVNTAEISSKNVLSKQNVSSKKNIPAKQKVLLPTLKEQQRYVVYKIIFKDAKKNISTNSADIMAISKLTNFGIIHNDIIMQCNNLMGIFDGANAGLISAKYNADKLSGIIRVNNDYVDKLKLCLGLITTVNTRNVIIDCIYVSGMLNKAIDKMDA